MSGLRTEARNCILLALASTAAVLSLVVALEAGLRFRDRDERTLDALHAYSESYGWTPRRGFRVRSAAGAITVNRKGYRGLEHELARTPGLARVVMIGDSITFGPGVDVFFNFNEEKATFIAPTVDVAWRHGFGERAALMLGVNAGVGVGLSGRDDNNGYGSISGKVTPLISFFTGLRY